MASRLRRTDDSIRFVSTMRVSLSPSPRPGFARWSKKRLVPGTKLARGPSRHFIRAIALRAILFSQAFPRYQRSCGELKRIMVVFVVPPTSGESSCRHPWLFAVRIWPVSRRKKPETRMALRREVTTFQDSLCNVPLRRHRRHFNLASADRVFGQPTRKRDRERERMAEEGSLCLGVNNCERERLISRAAQLSDKLAICQQQTPPWSRSADWHPGDNHLVAENYGSASVSARHDGYTELPLPPSPSGDRC